jgi:6-phosphogluconolactonase
MDQFVDRIEVFADPPVLAHWSRGLRRTESRSSRPLFDIVLLGMGPDGHTTTSLLPGNKVLEERQLRVAAVAHGRPEIRITMTYPAIESSRHVAFLVEGAAKAPMLSTIRAGRELACALWAN